MQYEKPKKVSKNPRENSSETVANKNGKEILKEIPKERYISLNKN